MLAHLYWDPDPVAFYIPFINHPVVWYGVCFAFAFFVGYYLLQFFLQRFLCFYPEITEADLLDPTLKLDELKAKVEGPIEKEPPLSLLLFFAKKVLSKEQLSCYCNRLMLERQLGRKLRSLKAISKQLTEQLTLYIVLGTVLGARIGHILFYEPWGPYLQNPLLILKTWEGGLASHGAIVGIFLGIVLFLYRSRKKFPMISFVRVLDLLVIPAMYAGGMIRFGNFINQEVLGKITNSPFGIIFGSPASLGPAAARHPAQLYEAAFYFGCCIVFVLFFRRCLFPKGRLAGLCLASTFLFRFLIEFIKEEQSFHVGNQMLTMGQYLSIPFVIVGLLFYFLNRPLFKRG